MSKITVITQREHCDCGAFLTSDGLCNKCGAWRCETCGCMWDSCDYCEYCEPEEGLQMALEAIEYCKNESDVKDCKKCDSFPCIYIDDVNYIKSLIKEEQE